MGVGILVASLCVGFWHSQESGFYYLKSRYYDPEICRFINADGLASTGQGFLGCNMFAYCNNNPVDNMDASGKMMSCCQSTYELEKGCGGFELINGQGLEPYNSMPYGISTVGFSGCESIAIYNALILIGKACSLNTVIEYMFQSINDGGGYGLYGLGGGTCFDIASTLTKLNVDYSWADYNTLCNVEESTVMIVGFWGKYYPFKNCDFSIPSVHTIAIQRIGGQFVAYNRYNEYPYPYPKDTLEDIIGGEEKFFYGFIINK